MPHTCLSADQCSRVPVSQPGTCFGTWDCAYDLSCQAPIVTGCSSVPSPWNLDWTWWSWICTTDARTSSSPPTCRFGGWTFWCMCNAHEITHTECCLEDVDDCPAAPCQQVCTNLVGSWSSGAHPELELNYTCSCHPEHVLNPDQITCTDCRCPPGLERAACVLPLPECSGCNKGSYKDWLGVGPCNACEACPAGSMRVDCGGTHGGSCQQCPAGKFKPDLGLWNAACVECQPCAGTSSATPLRAGCGVATAGDCVGLAVQSPDCTSTRCTTWWAGNRTEVAIVSTAPLCASTEACGHFQVSLFARTSQGAQLVGDLGAVSAALGTRRWTLAVDLPAHTPGGHSYYVHVTATSSAGPAFDGHVKSDEFVIRDHFDRLRV